MDCRFRRSANMSLIKKIMDNTEMEKNGGNDNCLEEMICDNITNNNHSNILELKSEDNNKENAEITNLSPKKLDRTNVDKSTAQSNGSPVLITVQESHNQGLPMEKPRRRIRRTSDVIDSYGMNTENPPSPQWSHITPHKLEFRRASTGGMPSPFSDTGYDSSVLSTPPSPWWTTKSPEVGRRRADTVDAARMKPVETHEDEPISLPTEEARMPVDRNAEEYNMNHPRRGHAVIFNNDEFEMPGTPPRAGSEIDVDNLQKLYSALGFQITIHHNKEYSEIRAIITQLAEEDHTDADCLVITVLSHGMHTGYIHAKDVPYNVEYLWTPFTGDKCLTLAGKPKIFFIQACRGEKLDPGVQLVHHKRSRTQTDSSANSYKIPTHADFLIMYSSVEGFYSWRNPDFGTWFIQCLCQELLENADKCDLLKLLTRTSRRVAIDHESFNDGIPWQHEQKQVPTITSMLIREVFFRPKK